jgi:iduronate 2-sulfatase
MDMITKRKKENTKILGFLNILVLTSITMMVSGQDEKPLNVLFIGIDDMKVETKSYGYEHMITPNIDRLAEMGLQFNRAYVQQAICAASRASLLTGCRPNTTTVDYPYNAYFTDEFLVTHSSIAEYYTNAGYYTRTLGKIHHSFKDKNVTENHYKS